MNPRLPGLLTALIAVALTTQACAALGPGSSLIPTEDPFLEIPRITAEQAKAALDSGAAAIVDVRSQSQYERGRISGASSIPLDQIIAGEIGPLEPDDWIITYCT